MPSSHSLPKARREGRAPSHLSRLLSTSSASPLALAATAAVVAAGASLGLAGGAHGSSISTGRASDAAGSSEYTPFPLLDAYFSSPFRSGTPATDPKNPLTEVFARGFRNYADSLSIVFRKRRPDDATEAADAAMSDADREFYSIADGINASDAKVFVRKALRSSMDPLLNVARGEVIDVDSITRSPAMQLMTHNDGAHITSLGGASFQQIFLYSFYIMYERRRGKASRLYAWLASLPRTFATEGGGALYWPQGVAECLDEIAAAELIALQSVVGTVVQGANACCEIGEDEIRGFAPCEAIAIDRTAEPFTVEEAKWAMSVYLRYNYKDQLILPGLNFFRRANSDGAGVYVRAGRDGQSFDVFASRDLKRHDEPVWNYPRGPGSSLVVFGSFDETSSSTDIPLRLPENAPPGTPVHKQCIAQRDNLVFLPNGKPKEQVIKCLGAMMLLTRGNAPAAMEKKKSWKDKKNKKDAEKVNKMRGNDPELVVDIYGNLTLIAHRQLSSIVNATKNDKCDLTDVPPQQREVIFSYLRHAARTYNGITRYLADETDRLATAAGLPSRIAVFAKDGARVAGGSDVDGHTGDHKSAGHGSDDTVGGCAADTSSAEDEE